MLSNMSDWEMFWRDKLAKQARAQAFAESQRRPAENSYRVIVRSAREIEEEARRERESSEKFDAAIELIKEHFGRPGLASQRVAWLLERNPEGRLNKRRNVLKWRPVDPGFQFQGIAVMRDGRLEGSAGGGVVGVGIELPDLDRDKWRYRRVVRDDELEIPAKCFEVTSRIDGAELLAAVERTLGGLKG